MQILLEDYFEDPSTVFDDNSALKAVWGELSF